VTEWIWKPAVGAFIVWLTMVFLNYCGAKWYQAREREKRLNNLRRFMHKQTYKGPDKILDEGPDEPYDDGYGDDRRLKDE